MRPDALDEFRQRRPVGDDAVGRQKRDYLLRGGTGYLDLVARVENQPDVTVRDLVVNVDLIQIDDGIGAVRRFEEEKTERLFAFHTLKYIHNAR